MYASNVENAEKKGFSGKLSIVFSAKKHVLTKKWQLLQASWFPSFLWDITWIMNQSFSAKSILGGYRDNSVNKPIVGLPCDAILNGNSLQRNVVVGTYRSNKSSHLTLTPSPPLCYFSFFNEWTNECFQRTGRDRWRQIYGCQRTADEMCRPCAEHCLSSTGYLWHHPGDERQGNKHSGEMCVLHNLAVHHKPP